MFVFVGEMDAKWDTSAVKSLLYQINNKALVQTLTLCSLHTALIIYYWVTANYNEQPLQADQGFDVAPLSTPTFCFTAGKCP
jgi:hypothetical protein